MFKKKNLVFLLSGIVVGATFVALMLARGGEQTPVSPQPVQNSPTSVQTPTAYPTDKNQGLPERGVIEGSLSYPSEGIPTDMKICAETLESRITTCTQTHIKGAQFMNKEGYRLVVPTGKYYVYATLPNDTYKAYYDEFVTCGLSSKCTSHEPIVVEVKANETTSNVDPHDWYNTPTP